jgi:hypothetical protein
LSVHPDPDGNDVVGSRGHGVISEAGIDPPGAQGLSPTLDSPGVPIDGFGLLPSDKTLAGGQLNLTSTKGRAMRSPMRWPTRSNAVAEDAEADAIGDAVADTLVDD